MEFIRGDKVNFKGNEHFKPYEGTYVWASNGHLMLTYYIEHPDGGHTKESIAHNNGMGDGFESAHSSNFRTGINYIIVFPNEIEMVEPAPRKIESLKRMDKVNFKGNEKFKLKPYKGTYIWAVSHHEMLSYYIQHPQGNMTKEDFESNGGFKDGFESPHSENFISGVKYLCVLPEEVELVK